MLCLSVYDEECEQFTEKPFESRSSSSRNKLKLNSKNYIIRLYFYTSIRPGLEIDSEKVEMNRYSIKSR